MTEQMHDTQPAAQAVQSPAEETSTAQTAVAEAQSAAPAQDLSKGLSKYLIFAFGIAWALFITGCVMTLNGNAAAFTLFSSLGMFAPLIAACIVSRGISRKKTGVQWKPLFKGRWGWWLLAWVSPALLTLLGAGLFFVLFPAAFDPTCSEYLTAKFGAATAAATMANLTPAAYMAIGCVQALLGAFFNMLFAVGEEAGWRGYMYPRLKARFGEAKGRIVGGLIWGSWHWPLIILVGYEYNLGIFNAPWYMVLAGMGLFCIVCVALGTLMDFFYEKAGNIWAPALAHGAFNAIASFGLMMTTAAYLDRQMLGPMPISVIGGLPLFLTAAVILARSARKKA
ncbi:MAG: CPBP family intramembrane metalloprotease [Faecalibacterium sp.]|jgi:membrane protease YdiL (CAAX protease family)|nr:CPBP family intramembrane metalloprotease [Faecalibacterium sp.]